MKINDILYEMSWYDSKTTGLPSNIKLWLRSDLVDHGHNRYRVKISKDNEWAAIYSVGHESKMLKDINSSLKQSEDKQIKEFISSYFSVIIHHIDGKLDSGEFAYEIKKLRG